jgi:hypothetical protein
MEYKLEDLSIHPKILAENKYNKFNDSTKRYNEEYMESWQKTIYNDYGKAYFINFNFYNMTHIYSQHKIKGNPYSWEADLQFNSLDNDMTVNIKVFGTHRNLHSVENFCEKMFNQMQFKNYDYYSDEDEYKHKKGLEVINDVNELEKELPKSNTKKKNTKRKI